MRADRLLSLLMLLQTRGRMTARELSSELEVSERTIYRDITALSTAGVPVYGEAGPEGGFSLVESYRTNLTGLSPGEVQALFMLSVPEAFSDLGVSQECKAALLKLSAALPENRRSDEIRVRQRFYLDSTWWHNETGTVPHLKTIQQAVWEDRRLLITDQPIYSVRLDRVVSPYGLVVKAGVWHLVFENMGTHRVLRVSDFIDVKILDETFKRREDFDLAAFWKAWCADQQATRHGYPVLVRISPDLIPFMPMSFGESVRSQLDAAEPEPDGWVQLQLSFESLIQARGRLLAFGRSIEVLDPYPLRRSIQDLAEQITSLYEPKK